MIRFVSNLPRDLRTGGFSAMNAAAFKALFEGRAAVYAGPIDPPTMLWEKALSKGLRLAGAGGDFFFFSHRRLDVIARQVEAADTPAARMDFFQGFTPWVMTQPRRPYAAWSDCTFHDYIDIFHDRRRFSGQDLARIEQAEARWLSDASRVLFTSAWAATRAIAQYGLDPGRVRSLGIFGELEPPASDIYAGAAQFAFVSTNFAAKGGPVAVEAFRDVRRRHPEASLVIVGDRPADISSEPGVDYAGFLRKEVPDELQRFRQILASSVALTHPTNSDISPLLIVEAASFGCPAISSRAFAIPEMVDDNQTGLLLDPPAQAPAVAAAMNWMLEHPGEYAQMRAKARRRARTEHGKDQFEARLLAAVDEVLAETAAVGA